MSSSFLTLSGNGTSLIKDRGSKFIGLASPVTGDNDIKLLLEIARKEYPAARHYCYAWRLGAEGQHVRSNDDGEPSGSAGRPILGQLVAHNVTNALVIVVRYFGGTLLGVGGLMQAYKAAASEAILSAGIITSYVMCECKVSFPAEDTSAVMRILKEHDAEIKTNGYDHRNYIIFKLREMHRQGVQKKFSELYRAELTDLDASLP